MSGLPHLGISSNVYPLEAADLAALKDYDGPPIPDEALPDDDVLLYIRPDGEDVLLRGRRNVDSAASGDARATLPARVVFKPSIAKWNLVATLVRTLRNRHRYHGTAVYHISPRAVRALGLERAIRTLENPQLRKNKDRAASMRRLAASLRTRGYDDARPINVMLCRTCGRTDSLRQGHHRVSACLECGIDRMAVHFSAAGALPGCIARLFGRRGAFALPGPETQIEGARVILENKYINDRFLEGRWRGVACIVKESSKAVWSIGNEYRMGSAMHAAAPTVVARPLVWRHAADGSSAWVATEKVAGPSLAELLEKGLSTAQADAFAADILTLARALGSLGILHRDLFADNLLLDSDGHLKAIDWQLAIDRALPREDPWVKRHWKFRYVVFGVNRDLGLGVWNDFLALARLLARFPQTEAVRAARAELEAGAGAMTYADPPRGLDRIRLWLYGLSLRMQMLLRGRRHRKYAQLERRWRTVRGEWKEDS